MRKVLLLNASGEALNLIPWTRAINLVLRGRVHVYEYFEGVEVRSQRQTFKVPSVIGLIRYIFIPRGRKVSLSKKNLLIRDGFKCSYCDRGLSVNTCTVDHVVPVTRGGSKTWQNVVAACKPCNVKKRNRTPEEAKMVLLRKPFVPTRGILLKEAAEKEGYAHWRPYFEGA